MMQLQIDSRETDLIQMFQQQPIPSNIEIQTSNLDIGDIIIGDRIIIERKTIADLNASIVDGRYVEQSYRLTNSRYPNHNIIYLIEGSISGLKSNELRIISAIFSLNFYKGFSVIRTINIRETFTFILQITTKMLKDPKKLGYYESSGRLNTETLPPLPTESVVTLMDISASVEHMVTEKEYVSVVKSCKKENITANNIDEIMLCQIPGISTQTALSIISHFGTLQNMISLYSIEGETILNTVKVTNVKGKETKLNKTVINNILKFIFKKT